MQEPYARSSHGLCQRPTLFAIDRDSSQISELVESPDGNDEQIATNAVFWDIPQLR